MTLDLLAWTWTGAFVSLLYVFVLLLCVILVTVILIQDSKDGGLGGAFGGAGGGSALLGARMQKDLAKFTGVCGFLLALSVVLIGMLSAGSGSVAGDSTPIPEESTSTTAGGSQLPGGINIEDLIKVNSETPGAKESDAKPVIPPPPPPAGKGAVPPPPTKAGDAPPPPPPAGNAEKSKAAGATGEGNG